MTLVWFAIGGWALWLLGRAQLRAEISAKELKDRRDSGEAPYPRGPYPWDR